MTKDDITRCILFSLGGILGFGGLSIPASAPDWLAPLAAGLALAFVTVGFGIRDSDD